MREEHSGIYENIIRPVPDPNNWFHAKLVVTDKQVSVYVNDSDKPTLEVSLLSNRKDGMIGLYVADRSGGTFANLSIMNN